MYKSSISIEVSKNGSGGLLKRKFASLKRKISKKNKNVVKSSSESIYSALFNQFISPRKIYYPYKSCNKCSPQKRNSTRVLERWIPRFASNNSGTLITVDSR